jgi:hypothetical protein
MVLALAVGTLVTIAVARVVLGAWAQGIGASFADEAVGQAVGALAEAVLDDLYAILLTVAGIAIVVTALVVARGALPDSVRGLARPVGGVSSRRSTVRAVAERHAADLRWAGVGVVGFVVLWRVAGIDTALLAAVALGAWLAVVNWLTTPQRRIGAASAVSGSDVV